ncbi:hypothetical protein J3F83DRAFT_496627 [Trichoderma novae-zelandiae]
MESWVYLRLGEDTDWAWNEDGRGKDEVEKRGVRVEDKCHGQRGRRNACLLEAQRCCFHMPLASSSSALNNRGEPPFTTGAKALTVIHTCIGPVSWRQHAGVTCANAGRTARALVPCRRPQLIFFSIQRQTNGRISQPAQLTVMACSQDKAPMVAYFATRTSMDMPVVKRALYRCLTIWRHPLAATGARVLVQQLVLTTSVWRANALVATNGRHCHWRLEKTAFKFVLELESEKEQALRRITKDVLAE